MMDESEMFMCLRTETNYKSTELSNDPSGSITGWEVIEQMSNYKLLKEDYAFLVDRSMRSAVNNHQGN